MCVLSNEDFNKQSTQNKNCKNFGKRSICFNGKKTKNYSEHCKVQYEKYLILDFSFLKS